MRKYLFAGALCVLGLLILVSPPPESGWYDEGAQWRSALTYWVFALLLVTSQHIYRNSDRLQMPTRGLPQRRLAAGFLLLVFWVLRTGRRCRRWVFGGHEPKWAGDVYGLFSYVNVIGLIPTFAVVAASPEHFFSRVPSNGTSFNALYKPPLKILTSFATLISVLVVSFETATPRWKYLKWIVIIAALAVPALMLVLCLTIRAMYLLFIPTSFRRLWVAANLVSGNMVEAVFSWRTYTTLNWSRYYWSAIYFYVYAYLALMFCLGVGVLVSIAFLHPVYGVMAFILCANRWIVYRYFILLCATSSNLPKPFPCKEPSGE
jgi:hypothetical protein